MNELMKQMAQVNRRLARLETHEHLANVLYSGPSGSQIALGLTPFQFAMETAGPLMFLMTTPMLEVAWDSFTIASKWTTVGISAANARQAGSPLGSYYTFDGATEYLYASAGNHYHMHGTHNNVLVVIGRASSASAADGHFCTKYDEGSGLREFFMMYDDSEGQLAWYVGDDNTYDANQTVNSTNYTDDKWFLAVCTCKAGAKNKMAVWCEGTTVDSMAFIEAANVNAVIHNGTAALLGIGARDQVAGFTGFLNGDIALVFHKRILNTETVWWDDIDQIKSLVWQVMPHFCTVT